MLESVRVPAEFEPVFSKAQEYVKTYFAAMQQKPQEGTIEFSGERYILVRAASLSVEFFDTVKTLYRDVGEEQAIMVAQSLLYDIAHAIGKSDARNFHSKMNLSNPVEKLSAGPVHFAYTGWAFVDIHGDSVATPDEHFCLIYDHPFSFESDSWKKTSRTSLFPVCIMNSGYSSGWCEESFGIPLVAVEILCTARGDSTCRFVMAQPSCVEKCAGKYLEKFEGQQGRVTSYEMPEFLKRKRMEEALRESGRQVADIHESISDGLFTLDENLVLLQYNSAAERLLGRKREEVLNRPLFDAFPEARGSIFEEKYRLALKEKTALAFEVDFGVSPLENWYNVRVYPHKKGITVYFQVVTEQKKAEMSLRESEEKFQLITRAAYDAIIMMDPEGRVTYWNPAAEKIFGYSKEEILGQHLHYTLAPAHYFEAYNTAFEHWKKTGEGAAIGRIVELEARHKNGTIFPIELSLSSAKTGSRWHAIGIVRDITDRKNVERQLRLAKEAADAANIAKSEFLATMSHEIRTPMNGLLGMTGLLIDTELSPQQKEYVELIRKSGDQLLSIINEILDFSKIEAGKLELEIVDFNLRDTLEDTNELLAIKAGEKDLEFSSIVDHEVPSLLRGDPVRLRQILLNLGGNAVKFTNRGEVTIHVTLERESPSEATIKFTVSDTGIGIPPDRIDRLFKSFSQVDASTTRRFGGTGLGLAISKRLCDMMGGEIAVKSTEGKGSEFSFKLTFIRQQHMVEYSQTLPDSIRSRPMLIVDDNEMNRRVLRELLGKWQCTFDEAPDARAALRKLNEAAALGKPFHIAIIDHMMPEMDGEALGRVIKSDRMIKGTKMVLLTSAGTRGRISHFQEIGFSYFLTKPLKRARLYECLFTLGGELRSPAVPASRLESSGAERLKKGRVLVVEDNIINQKVILNVLEKAGYRADTASNGIEAIKAFTMAPYDLVFMDVQMPEMDGFDATSAIRQEEEKKGGHVPIVAMTAYAMKGDKERCIEAGMDDYLSKPVHRGEMLALVEKYLAQAAGKDDSEKSIDTEKFNEGILLKLLDGDRSLLKEILDTFLDTTPPELEKMAQAFNEENFAALSKIAHSLKGAALNIGARAMGAAAESMEHHAAEGDGEKIKKLYRSLMDEYDSLALILKGIVRQ
ncbi:MAG: response regulator [Candidatus Eremiobacteraeota bacterium]|nr:response regulator [Candidatus Eremiobacteraeota bacterium]